MKIQELKKLVLFNKKTDKNKSQAYVAILAQVQSKTVGVKWDLKDEEQIVLNSFKKELKEQLQSKDSGAPFSELVIEVCEKHIAELSPNMISEETVQKIIFEFFVQNPNAKIGQFMGFLKKTYGDSIDMKFANKLVRELLSN